MTESAFKKLVTAAESGESRQYPHVDEAFLWASGEIERLQQENIRSYCQEQSMLEELNDLRKLKESQQAPAVADHIIAKTINDLRDVAIKYHGAQQLREQIASIVRPLLRKSPAVAVHDECCATGQSCEYEVCTLNGEQQCKYCGKDHPGMQSPQRVTEQDAAAIYESAIDHYKYTQSFNRLAWLHMSGRALLAKLNWVTE